MSLKKILRIKDILSPTHQPIQKIPKFIEMCSLTNNIMDYYVVSQGKTTIPNVDDGEEFQLTDVR